MTREYKKYIQGKLYHKNQNKYQKIIIDKINLFFINYF